MGFPVDPSVANYSNSGTGADSRFIPEVWSNKLVEKFYGATVFSEIANTDYEGEIKSYGDTVHIRTTPDITINDYVKGAGITYEYPESSSIELNINKGKYFAFELFDIDKHQTDLQLMDSWATDGGSGMKKSIDTDVLGNSYAEAGNAGATAGVESGDINLGVAGIPLSITKDNILEILIDYGTVLDEQEAPDENRYVVLPPRVCGLIKKSDLSDASITGDAKSTLRTGRLGAIDGLTLYRSNRVNKTGAEWDIIFGHKNAITFAAQITHMEQMRNPNEFGDIARSLMVYGYKVVDPKMLGHSVVTLG